MSKVRFDGLDVQAMVASLQDTLLGRRIVNVYDGIVGGETYVFKLEGDGSAKDFLLMESGIRFHKISNFQAEATSMPSPFAAKLRKHVRSLRLEQIQQIGSDRVVIFQFGVGNSKHCIILELYAKGNIVLTDKDYTVLALLRSHVYTEDAASSSKNNGSVMVQVGQVYPVAYSTMLGEEKKVSSEQSASLKEAMEMTLPEFHEWSRTLVQKAMESTGKRKKKQRASTTLKMLLSQNADSGVAQLGPALIEHCILTANIEPNANLIPLLKEDTGVSIWSEEDWCRLQKAFHDEAPRILDSLIHTSRGYVLYRLRGGSNAILSGDTDDTVAHADKILEEFQPLLLKQHQRRSWIEYNSFSDAVEDFFDHLQQQKIQQKVEAAEKAAKAKLEKIRADIQERLAALETQQQKLQQEAKVVQLHADSVDKALAVINSALDTGMDWEQLNQVIEVEQRLNKNPIALLIHKLDLEHEAMILRLPLFTSDIRTVQNDQAIDVRVSLNESAYSNANILFAKYRSSKEKSQKTIEASTKALKAAEETAMRQLADAQKRSRQTLGAAVIGGKRKPAWFEKFRWFITTENYLVLGGKDAHQNELLVKRYLRPGDAYLHADVQGAASCILRAKRKRDSKSGGTVTVPFSEQSLREAGNFTICHSSAWNSRMITSAWWVESHQVSKTAPTGEYLTVGSFMIRGKKNFLPPASLEMGLGIMFRLGDEDSLLRHKNERRDFALRDDDYEEKITNENAEMRPEDSRPCREDVTSDVEALTRELSLDHVVEEETKAKEVSDSESINSNDNQNDNDEVVDDGKLEENSKKRGLSVKDRKLIKKYGSLEAAQTAIASKQKKPCNETETLFKNSVAENVTQEQNINKRGKRGKLKKLKKKYADQDDEDRELAMTALQGGEKFSKKGGKSDKVKMSLQQLKVAAETVALLVKDSASVAERFTTDIQLLLAECVTVVKQGHDPSEARVAWEKFDADTLEQLLELSPVEAQTAAAKRLLALKRTTRVDNFSASLSGIIRTIRKYGYEKLDSEMNDTTVAKRKGNSDKKVEESSWKKTMADEGIIEGELNDDAIDDTIELGKLTGKPHPDDLLLSAVPVCAPYQSISQYTYRIKLTPGNMKRGKSSKQCLELFLKSIAGKTGDGLEKQIELIKQVGENDWVQAICADVKISAPGISKFTKQQKLGGKKAKKNK